MALVVLFLVIFGIGPLLYHAGLSRAEVIARARFVMLVPALLGLSGFGAQVLAGASWGRDIWATLPGMVLVWLGWIALLIYCTARILPRVMTPRGRRMTRAVGAMGTTAPWFGLASAQMVTG